MDPEPFCRKDPAIGTCTNAAMFGGTQTRMSRMNAYCSSSFLGTWTVTTFLLVPVQRLGEWDRHGVAAPPTQPIFRIAWRSGQHPKQQGLS